MVCPVSSQFFSPILLAKTLLLFCTPFFFAAAVFLLSHLLVCRTLTFFFWKLLQLCLRYCVVLAASFLTATAMPLSFTHLSCRPKRNALKDPRGCTVRFPRISLRTMFKGTAGAGTGPLPDIWASLGRTVMREVLQQMVDHCVFSLWLKFWRLLPQQIHETLVPEQRGCQTSTSSKARNPIPPRDPPGEYNRGPQRAKTDQPDPQLIKHKRDKKRTLSINIEMCKM